MTSGAATTILSALRSGGVEVVVSGGWAVDALLGEQTRPHGALDVWLPARQFDRLVATLADIGLDRLYPWGDDRPWNFVLHDGGSLRVDLHVYEPVDASLFHYGSAVGGDRFPMAALNGSGAIEEMQVACESPEWAVRWHTGYPARAVDRQDVARLCDRFGLDVPEEYL